MTVSQMGKDSQGTADTSIGSVHAGSTGMGQNRVLQDGTPCEECFPGRSFGHWCVEKEPINYNKLLYKLLTIDYNSVFGIPSEGMIGMIPQDGQIWVGWYFCRTGRLSSIWCTCLGESEHPAEGRGVDSYQPFSLIIFPKWVLSQLMFPWQLWSSMKVIVQ